MLFRFPVTLSLISFFRLLFSAQKLRNKADLRKPTCFIQIIQRHKRSKRYNSYYYCYNSDSAVHSFREDYAGRYIDGMKKIRMDLEKEKVMARLQDEYDSCVLYHLLLIAVNYSFHPENPVTGKKRIENFRILLKKEMFRNSLKNVHPENFSMTRKVTLICIQLHLYRMVQLIAGVRHRQRRK